MNASDVYSILYLFNKEIKKTSKSLSLGNVFSEANERNRNISDDYHKQI